MCTVCGCSTSSGKAVSSGDRTADADATPLGHHRGGDAAWRLVTLERDILEKNANFANANRRLFRDCGVFAVNLVSSPGSGKTTLLARTAADLRKRLRLAVIEGDQHSARDAERLRAASVPAVQINTGKVCHLDAHMVSHAVAQLELARGGILFIENVGNLVCPASFDLGEHHKVIVLSVTEGEDKPLKYPDMFAAADLMIVNKIDLLPHLDFDISRCVEYARRINPNIEVIELSATRGAGINSWYAWLEAGRERAVKGASPKDGAPTKQKQPVSTAESPPRLQARFARA